MNVQKKNQEVSLGELIRENEQLKKSCEELKKSKEHYQHLIENAGEIITVLNYDGTVRFENPALKRILGYDSDEVLDENLLNYVHPNDRNFVELKIAKIIKSVGNKGSLEFRYKHKYGSWRYLECFVKNIIDPIDGAGLLFNSRDITERVTARKELERSKKQMAHAHQIARIGEWELDLKNDKIVISDELRTLMGIPQDVPLDTLEEALKTIHPDDRAKAGKNIMEAIEHNKSYSYEHRVIHADGKERILFGRGEVVTDEHGNAVKLIGIGQDITETKETEKTLKNYTQQLKSLTAKQERVREDERMRIARDIHDELGQMLTVLKMDISSSINRRKKEYGDRYMSRYSEEISEVINGIDTIIQSVQRITMELRPDALVDLDLREALEWHCSEFQKQSGIRIKFFCKDNSINRLDEERATVVFRIFQELLTNIMRHAEATKVKVELAIVKDHLLLQVFDNGKGISKDEIDHPDSLGILGMKERCAIFGGTITFKGDSKKGTLVTLKIPCSG